MAGLHQWKKYNIAYDYEWALNRQKRKVASNMTTVYVVSNNNGGGYKYYTSYSIDNNGNFVLGNLKHAHNFKRNEKIYVHESTHFQGEYMRGKFSENFYTVPKSNSSRIVEFTIINYPSESRIEHHYGGYEAFSDIQILSTSLKSKTPKKGNYISEVQGIDGAFPIDGPKDGYWYVYDKALNQSPTISGSDLDLGSKTDDFDIEYVVSDADGDVVKVTILVDGVAKISDKPTSLGVIQKHRINIGDFTLGDHSVKIKAVDSKGASAPIRTYYFTKTNTAPKISGLDGDLGGKSTPFTVSYRVEDKDADSVSVRISLDDKELSSISDAQNKDLRFTLDEDKIKSLTIGQTYTLTIKADDGKGGVAYRRYTFTKTNMAPVISGNDRDLGKVKTAPSISFSVSDVEKDKIYFSLLLDGKEVMKSDGAEDGRSYSYKVKQDIFLRLSYGKHELKLYAWDDESVDKKVLRKFTFERISDGLDVEVKLGEYSTRPKKIVAVPHGVFAETGIMKVYACNNYLDSSRKWEDITNMSKIARAFTFSNSSKTASKWAICIKVVINNGSADISSVLRGIKGGIE